MVNKIIIKSSFTNDVKIAQKALESIGFKTIKEFDNPEAYNVILSVPKEHYFELFCEDLIKLSKNKY